MGGSYSPKDNRGWVSLKGVEDAEGGRQQEVPAPCVSPVCWGLIDCRSLALRALTGLLAVFTGLRAEAPQHGSDFPFKENLPAWGVGGVGC